jgi:hypothetical protein
MIGVGVTAFNSLVFYSSPLLPVDEGNFEPDLYLYTDPSNLVSVMLSPYIINEAGTNSVPKRRRIKFSCRGINQKKDYNPILSTRTLLPKKELAQFSSEINFVYLVLCCDLQFDHLNESLRLHICHILLHVVAKLTVIK